MTPDEIAARKKRNLALALALVAFVVLVFGLTMARLAQNIEQGRAEEARTGQPVPAVGR
ncbi:hypothetical protein Q0812_01205 [Brevundimonas sp. 2R-24]|uniref:Cytochrome C oxidase assembly protein n=1 Tax=Peiella sedimenti TaxID=3061083 RepID=A0ABT8SHJ5_9CAUL|nr:hypothetical protein [Caulobacteraceae bacterium XZ-24]